MSLLYETEDVLKIKPVNTFSVLYPKLIPPSTLKLVNNCCVLSVFISDEKVTNLVPKPVDAFIDA